MEEKKYIDLLLVEKTNGGMALAVAESCNVDPGCIVEFDNGDLGRVIKKAWAGEKHGEIRALVSDFARIYEVKAAYRKSWESEANNAGDSQLL